MARNLYGIVDFGYLKTFELNDTFQSATGTELDESIFTENQKKILKEVAKGTLTKLIYIREYSISDSGGTLFFGGNSLLSQSYGGLVMYGFSDGDSYCSVLIKYVEEDDKYYAYS